MVNERQTVADAHSCRMRHSQAHPLAHQLFRCSLPASQAFFETSRQSSRRRRATESVLQPLKAAAAASTHNRSKGYAVIIPHQKYVYDFAFRCANVNDLLFHCGARQRGSIFPLFSLSLCTLLPLRFPLLFALLRHFVCLFFGGERESMTSASFSHSHYKFSISSSLRTTQATAERMCLSKRRIWQAISIEGSDWCKKARLFVLLQLLLLLLLLVSEFSLLSMLIPGRRCRLLLPLLQSSFLLY